MRPLLPNLLRRLSLCSTVLVTGLILISCTTNSEKKIPTPEKPEHNNETVKTENPPATEPEYAEEPLNEEQFNEEQPNNDGKTADNQDNTNLEPPTAHSDTTEDPILKNDEPNANTQITLTNPTPTNVEPVDVTPKTDSVEHSNPTVIEESSYQLVTTLCNEIGNKLGSVSTDDCLNANLIDSGGRSLQKRAIVLKEFKAKEEKPSLGRVLLMGGIHGDEYSSVSIVFKWLNTLNQHHSGLFEWMVVPLLNPDGLLRRKSQRQNHAGVDLNRNFPTPDWNADALKYWRNRTYQNPRRYPGPIASSEPETQWFIQQISAFKPDAIVAVHAPHSLVDYDGPQKPPHKLGRLYLRELGIYPGSLGNYAGVAKNIPVVTIELPSAGIMPSDNEIESMWSDLVAWLQREVPKQRLARSQKNDQQAQ